MKPCISAAATLAICAWPATVSAARSPASPAQCEIAWSYIGSLLAVRQYRRTVFDLEPVFMLLRFGENLSVGWGIEREGQDPAAAVPPPAEIRKRFMGRSAVAACNKIRLRLAARHVGFGEAAMRWARRVPDRDHYRATMVNVSIPAISSDGRHALLIATRISGSLDGGGWFVHLVRDDRGHWQVAGIRGMWVS